MQTGCRFVESGKMSPLRVTVLAGGIGVEREVSVHSGRAVHAALNRLGHRAVICDIRPDDLSALGRPADFVFIALHGEFGEDGTLQRELDARGIPYCGSGADASELAFDKGAAKRRFIACGVPTPKYVLVEARDPAARLADFALPCVVKPVASGSSVGTSIAKDRAALMHAVAQRIDAEGQALVEEYIRGPELTVGVLEGKALPVCHIRTQREFYDYQAKYIDDDTEYLFDLDLPAELLRRVQELSVRAHHALGCDVFSRVDWMVDERTHEPFALEVNTIPGFTSHSLLPKAAARVGVDFDTLVDRILQASMARCARPAPHVRRPIEEFVAAR